MNVVFEVDELVHIARLLRDNLRAAHAALEENPLDITATLELERSRSCLIKLTLTSIDSSGGPEIETPDVILPQSRSHLN